MMGRVIIENTSVKICEWRLDPSFDNYETNCSEEFEGRLEDCGFKFCPFCGRPIKEVR